jgi:riboflavin synthase alpha subunit
MSKETFSGTVLFVGHLKTGDEIHIDRSLKTGIEIAGSIGDQTINREEKLNEKKDLIVLVIVP